MRYHLVFLVLVGFTCASSNPAWKDNTEYIYEVYGRTLTSLHGLADRYSGIFLKAKLYITSRPDGKLQARISDAQYAQIQTHMSSGWNTNIPESELSYKDLNLSDKPFHMVLEDGLIKSLIVEKGMANWEANIIKSIVSQFQLDIHGKKAIKSPINTLPRDDRMDGYFKTMEETVTGETETSYVVHRLPEYLTQSQPWLVPHPHLKGDGQVMEVVKNKNYTNSVEKPSYHYGFGDLKRGEIAGNKMGEFFLRQCNSRLILTGKLSGFTIQNIQTVNKIIVNPTMDVKEQGSVVSTLNVSLSEVHVNNGEFQELANPVEIGSLVYTYETPFATSNEVHKKQQRERLWDESDEEGSWQKFRNAAQRTQKWGSDEETENNSGPSMTEAPRLPLLPYFTGYQGRSIKSDSSFNLQQNVEKMAKEISEDLFEPEQILVRATLSKYVMLCSLVRIMNEKEISSIAGRLYTQTKQGQERRAWVAFRDAVAEAGTPPAFLNIQKWIKSHKMESEEAAEVVASMAYAVRAPTEEYMQKFFELIESHEVKNEAYLNETALLSFTRLLNRVYVIKKDSYNQYPVESLGNFNTKAGKKFVESEVIPYLSQKLYDAVSQADSRKIHFYIRALGNIGHKKILKAFEPYLEGEKQVSQFQRMLMVLCMDKLVMAYPVEARSVLYRIYQNTAEVPEVRTVAVYQLMRTVPPTSMIQHMAEQTNTDPQEQVNAAVKSAIEYISKLTSPGSQKLRKAAETARSFLTEKEYDNQQSFNLLQDFTVKNMNIEFKHNLLQVGSPDHDLPKGLKYSMRGTFHGMRHYFFNIQSMISSIKELTNMLSEQTEENQKAKMQRTRTDSSENQWSSAKIAESLNLQTNEREQLEGFIFSEMDAIQRVWSFDNETIERLPEVIREYEHLLRKGKDFSYTKLKQLKEMALSLPTESGLPFLYTYEMPLLIQFEGKMKAYADPKICRDNKLTMPRHIFVSIDASATVSTKVQSRLSIITPFDHQIYIAGNDKNFQVHVPLSGKVNMDFKDESSHVKFELEVKEPHRDARMLHYSSWPYTSRSDLMSMRPVALRSGTQRIRPEINTHRSFDVTLGQREAGMSFRVWGHHPHQSTNLLQLAKLLKTGEITTFWQQIWDDLSLQQTEASIAFIPNKSTTKKIILNIGYENDYRKQPEQRNEEEIWSVDDLSSKDSHKLLKHAGSGISYAKLHAVDVSMKFEGSRTYKHNIILAAAKSNVASRSRLVAIYENNSEKPTTLVLEVKAYSFSSNSMDTILSLFIDPESKYEIVFQQRSGQQQKVSKVAAVVNMNRSELRRQTLEKRPLLEECRRQLQQGNRLSTSCQKMIFEANYLDDIKIDLQYEIPHKPCLDYIDSLYKGVRFWYYPMTDIKSIQPENQSGIKIRMQFGPKSLKKVNVTIITSSEETKIYNIPVNSLSKSMVVPNTLREEIYKPVCVLDKNAAQTFSNLTYPLSLGKQWTLVMQYLPQQARLRGQTCQQSAAEQLRSQTENFALLVRELSSEQREIKIVFNHPRTGGKTVDITMKPKQQGSKPAASVLVDGKEVEFEDKLNAAKYNGFLEIYALPNGDFKMEFQNWFNMVFDGQRLKLLATSDKLRDSIVGLCGRFSQDIYEDFWTPNNCIVSSADEFINSFVVEDRTHSQAEHCVSKNLPLYTDVVSEYDVGVSQDDQQQTTGTMLRTRYVERDDDICFTNHPVPVCKSSTRSYVSRDVSVHCITKSEAVYNLKRQIDQGGNPDFSQKSRSEIMQVQTAQYCD